LKREKCTFRGRLWKKEVERKGPRNNSIRKAGETHRAHYRGVADGGPKLKDVSHGMKNKALCPVDPRKALSLIGDSQNKVGLSLS